MPRKSSRIPKYCLHKGSGQAYVTLNGRRHYLGVYDSDESLERYNRFVGELVTSPATKAAHAEPPTLRSITVVEVLAAYLKHAEAYYVKNGEPTAQLLVTKSAIPAGDVPLVVEPEMVSW